VPLSIGSKPKQSLRTKLDALLQNSPVRSPAASSRTHPALPWVIRLRENGVTATIFLALGIVRVAHVIALQSPVASALSGLYQERNPKWNAATF
jgi:hypothetical protein